MDASEDGQDDQPNACSFCDKTEADVRRLIAGHAAFICDECVRLCLTVVGAETEADAKPSNDLLQAWAGFVAHDQWALAAMAGLVRHFAERKTLASDAATDGFRMMELALNQVRRRLKPPTPRELADIVRCGFCSKSGAEIQQLTAGHGGKICGECLERLVKLRAGSDLEYRDQLVQELNGLNDPLRP